MSDNWNTYFSVIDNKPASFLLDLEPWKNGENEQYVYLYRLSVTLNDPNEDGVTTKQEYDGEYDGWETKVIEEKDSFQKRLKRFFKLQE
ncbi:hypothetical protein YSY43_37560 [Paenibacillus sp. YSY-4.3]